jgi:hypothetical protein
VIVRVGVIAAAALTCAGCANEHAGGSYYYYAGMHPSSSARGAESDDQAAGAHDQAPHKTMGAKVLTAIALERVTGRRPDPARLGELQ